MATYIMRELVEKNATNYIDHLNIHILPSANPDGYEHSRNSDRLWRKTRSSTGSILGCKGVDGNRNWGFHFDGEFCLEPRKLFFKHSSKFVNYRLSETDS